MSKIARFVISEVIIYIIVSIMIYIYVLFVYDASDNPLMATMITLVIGPVVAVSMAYYLHEKQYRAPIGVGRLLVSMLVIGVIHSFIHILVLVELRPITFRDISVNYVDCILVSFAQIVLMLTSIKLFSGTIAKIMKDWKRKMGSGL